MTFETFWTTVTEPQATIVAALLTVLAAVAGVGLGAWLFKGRVTDLKTALDESDGLLRDHQGFVEERLKELTGELNAQFTAIQEALGQLRGSVDVLEGTSGDGGSEAQSNVRDALRDDWAAIRDCLERIAADPDIDGRTRAKYGRIDRRSYGDLVDALHNDGVLGASASLYKEAIALFHKYRNGRKIPGKTDAKRMTDLRQSLVGAQVSW